MIVYRKYASLFLLIFATIAGCDSDEAVDPTNETPCLIIPEGDLYAEAELAFRAGCTDQGSIFFWEFGDGEISTLINPFHHYEKAGTYTISLTVTDDLDKSTIFKKKVDILPSPFIKHAGFIDEAEVWTEGLHLVTGDVYIRHGSLTIEPGANIRMNRGKSILVGHRETETLGGALFTAKGTATQPIIIHPSSGIAEVGSWGNIIFTDKASSASVIEHSEIKYGGKADNYPDSWEYYSRHGLVHVQNEGVTITNSVITGAANYGVYLSDQSMLHSFTGNTLSGSGNHPIVVDVDALHTVGPKNNIESNQGILVEGQYYHQQEATWYKQDVPYIFSPIVKTLNGPDGSTGAQLRIEAGTTIRFQNQSGLHVSVELLAEGTASEPIIFTSAAENKAKGDWANVWLSERSILNYCQFEYGGGARKGSTVSTMLEVATSHAKITNCTFKSASRDLVAYYLSNIDQIDQFENNKMQDSDYYGLSIEANQVPKIGTSNIFENTKGLEIKGGVIEEHVTWPKQSVPYSVGSDIYVQSSTECSLTIAPGTSVHLGSGASIFVAQASYYQGSLIADGMEEPIIFTFDKERSTGNDRSWGGIYFGEGTGADARMINCRVSYGGENMIRCDKAQGTPELRDNTISHSAGYGISLRGGATPVMSGNTFSDNALGDVHTY